jgi:hypothetical protein
VGNSRKPGPSESLDPDRSGNEIFSVSQIQERSIQDSPSGAEEVFSLLREKQKSRGLYLDL